MHTRPFPHLQKSSARGVCGERSRSWSCVQGSPAPRPARCGSRRRRGRRPSSCTLPGPPGRSELRARRNSKPCCSTGEDSKTRTRIWAGWEAILGSRNSKPPSHSSGCTPLRCPTNHVSTWWPKLRCPHMTSSIARCGQCLCVCVCGWVGVCMYICTHVHKDVCTLLYVRMYVCVYVCTLLYVRVYVWVYVYMYIYLGQLLRCVRALGSPFPCR